MENYIAPILLVFALVGCALTDQGEINETPSLEQIGQFFQLFKPSAAEPPEQADEHLLTRVQRRSLKPEILKDILKGYKKKREKISLRTVEDLVEMCEPSLKKCSYEGFESVIEIGEEFKETIPKLYEYSQYCLRNELRGFCQDNAAKVIRILRKKPHKKYRKLAKTLLEFVQRKPFVNDEQIVWAYFASKINVFPDEDEFEFLSRVKNALFLHYMEVLAKKTKNSVTKLINYVSSSNQEDEMSVTRWDTLDRIVERFIRLGSSKIKEELYREASVELARQFYDISLDLKGVQKILLEYKHKDVKILDDTVAELLEMCQESVTKCNYDDFERILRVGHSYKVAHPKLFEYRRHCAVVKLKGHCLDHIDEVVPNLQRGVYDDDKALVDRILELVQKDVPIDKAPTYQLIQSVSRACNQVKTSKLGKVEISLSEEKEFLARLKSAFFLRYLGISAESRAAPEDSVLATKRNHLSVIFENFIIALDGDIGLSMYGRAKEALLSQLEREDNRLTNENMREMLQEYEDKNAKICYKTVGEWVDMCKPSMSNCFHDTFSKIIKTTKDCLGDHPKIVPYSKYCAEEIVANYCRENAEKVLELVLGRISEGAKLMLFLLVKTKDDCLARETGENTARHCVNQALDKAIYFTFQEKLTHEDLFHRSKLLDLRQIICDQLKPFTELNYFFSAGLKYKKGQEGGPQGDFWRLSDEAEGFRNRLECSRHRQN